MKKKDGKPKKERIDERQTFINLYFDVVLFMKQMQRNKINKQKDKSKEAK